MLLDIELGVLKKFSFFVSPTNIHYKTGKFNWDKVDCASGYKVWLIEADNADKNIKTFTEVETVNMVSK